MKPAFRLGWNNQVSKGGGENQRGFGAPNKDFCRVTSFRSTPGLSYYWLLLWRKLTQNKSCAAKDDTASIGSLGLSRCWVLPWGLEYHVGQSWDFDSPVIPQVMDRQNLPWHTIWNQIGRFRVWAICKHSASTHSAHFIITFVFRECVWAVNHSFV